MSLRLNQVVAWLVVFSVLFFTLRAVLFEETRNAPAAQVASP